MCLAAAAFAQHAVDPSARYYRVICLVHLTGAGTHQDPLRPEYVPQSTDAAEKAGIVAWSILPTDDKRMAILQLVARDRHAFESLMSDKRPEVKVFEIGTHGKELIETALKLVRKDFDLEKFQVVAR